MILLTGRHPPYRMGQAEAGSPIHLVCWLRRSSGIPMERISVLAMNGDWKPVIRNAGIVGPVYRNLLADCRDFEERYAGPEDIQGSPSEEDKLDRYFGK